MNKICFVIVGPTASGKTNVAIDVAKHFNTEIISADSRQCYKELNIGVAKPSPEQLAAVSHYFISSHSIHETVNAKAFEDYASKAVENIFLKNDVAVMVGGTGLYINAFCNGIDEIPVINEEIKKDILIQYQLHGLEWLQKKMAEEDPVYYEKGEIKNPQRVLRALEVKLSTGRSILDYQKKQLKQHPFTIVKLGLDLPKEILHANVHNRVDAMMQQGLLNEVKSLVPYKTLNALNTVGYSELFDHLQGEYSLNAAIEKIKTNTRQYAKRQLTWFRKDKEITWLDALDKNSFIDFCEGYLDRKEH